MLKENLELVESRIREACRKAGRSREDVTLIAVSKTKPVEMLREAYDLGIRVFGENKEQAPKNKMKRINFKKTVFLQKEDVEKYIPEEYKKDGNKFIMRDAERTEYMVEWKANAKPDVKLYINEEQKTKDEFARIHELFGYKRVDGKSTVNEREHSRYDFDKMLAEARKL